MAIEDHLTKEEKIMAKIGVYYATDKRVIRYIDGGKLGKEEFSDLAYSQIVSVESSSERKNLAWAMRGVLLSIFGLIWLIVPIVQNTPLQLTDFINKIDNISPIYIGIIILTVGILGWHYGFRREAIIKFRAPGIPFSELNKYWTVHTDPEHADTLACTVREHLA